MVFSLSIVLSFLVVIVHACHSALQFVVFLVCLVSFGSGLPDVEVGGEHRGEQDDAHVGVGIAVDAVVEHPCECPGREAQPLGQQPHSLAQLRLGG